MSLISGQKERTKERPGPEKHATLWGIKSRGDARQSEWLAAEGSKHGFLLRHSQIAAVCFDEELASTSQTTCLKQKDETRKNAIIIGPGPQKKTN
jgi:hypothetical protein